MSDLISLQQVAELIEKEAGISERCGNPTQAKHFRDLLPSIKALQPTPMTDQSKEGVRKAKLIVIDKSLIDEIQQRASFLILPNGLRRMIAGLSENAMPAKTYSDQSAAGLREENERLKECLRFAISMLQDQTSLSVEQREIYIKIQQAIQKGEGK